MTDGCRLTLVYNLLRRGRTSRLKPPDHGSQQERVVDLLRHWKPGEPQKLVYPLQHAYTPAELDFAALKGADAAASQAACDLHLALLSVGESGIAEYSGKPWSRDDEDEWEAGEVTDRWVTLTEWRRPDGGQSPLGELPVHDEELAPPEALDDLDPDEQHFREATGNEGASFERSYQRAALVLWPHDRRLAVFCQAGLTVTLPCIDDLAQRWSESNGSGLWQEAHELAGHMIKQWPIPPDWHDFDGQREAPTDAARMLAVLARLSDSEAIEAFVDGVTLAGAYGKAITPPSSRLSGNCRRRGRPCCLIASSRNTQARHSVPAHSFWHRPRASLLPPAPARGGWWIICPAILHERRARQRKQDLEDVALLSR